VHGLTTEAGESIGEITAGGTLAFIAFAGVPAGILSGALYTILAPVLPSGRARGVLLGLVLLVLVATRIDQLRMESIDFLIPRARVARGGRLQRARPAPGQAGRRPGAAATSGAA
jgi:hypothetical protein